MSTDFGQTLYTPPIQVGNAEDFLPVRDNQGTNIAFWNPVFAEATAFYNIWKNRLDRENTGVCQYRRRLEFPEDFDFSAILSEGVICAQPLRLGLSVRRQYEYCHNRMDIALAEQAVKTLYPDMSDSWNKFIDHSNTLYYSNSFVLRSSEFARYCEFLFSVLDKVLNYYGCGTPEDVREMVEGQIKEGLRPSTRGTDYQMQIGGFLSECLWTLWVQHNYAGQITQVAYRKFENV